MRPSQRKKQKKQRNIGRVKRVKLDEGYIDVGIIVRSAGLTICDVRFDYGWESRLCVLADSDALLNFKLKRIYELHPPPDGLRLVPIKDKITDSNTGKKYVPPRL
jgi:hypothetical protein